MVQQTLKIRHKTKNTHTHKTNEMTVARGESVQIDSWGYGRKAITSRSTDAASANHRRTQLHRRNHRHRISVRDGHSQRAAHHESGQICQRNTFDCGRSAPECQSTWSGVLDRIDRRPRSSNKRIVASCKPVQQFVFKSSVAVKSCDSWHRSRCFVARISFASRDQNLKSLCKPFFLDLPF